MLGFIRSFRFSLLLGFLRGFRISLLLSFVLCLSASFRVIVRLNGLRLRVYC